MPHYFYIAFFSIDRGGGAGVGTRRRARGCGLDKPATMEIMMIAVLAGMILIAFFALYVIVVFINTNNKLSSAQQQLQNAIQSAFALFQTFIATLSTAVQRFTDKLATILSSFMRTMGSLFAQALKQATDFLTVMVGWVQSTANELQTQFFQLETNFREVVVNSMASFYQKLVTIPVDVGLRIVLDFTSLVTGTIHNIFCFVYAGFAGIANDLSGLFTNLQNWFTSTIYAPLASALSTVTSFVTAFPTTLLNFGANLLTSFTASLLANVVTPIINAFNFAIVPIKDSINTINGVINTICHFCVPVVGCIC
ncbi:MAG TPA: hypothetical protein VM260_20285 [Pirellula sp.]|nr:hypothetical protein [Pirellula sp.]